MSAWKIGSQFLELTSHLFSLNYLTMKKIAEAVKDAKRFVIITYEEEKQLTVDGVMIEIIPVWKWLIKN